MPKDDCALKCANCAHHKADEGQCRRYPPVQMITEDGAYWAFPDVDPEDYCGEFSPEN